MADLESKRVFLIASAKPEEAEKIESTLNRHIQNATVFTATDGSAALFKAENVIPNVVIVDSEISKISALDLTQKLIQKKERIAVIIMSPLPDTDHFVDEVVTGQVHILTRPTDEATFIEHLTRALNWIVNGDNANYRMKFLAANQILIREGEKAESVYLVKRGQLKAYKTDNGAETFLGHINPGEFVGEMAYINGEPRSANVMSLSNCELIEIPNNCLDVVLFSKPAWSKALVKTLSLRLKNSNEDKVQN
ncbi:cyclic nucleotide-binding domain-containing protein [Bdellovibrio bacteriovorus]|uniref:Cyclic AMP receptor protein,catabolite gene activator n=1 Tax=Bdellovibrio bacteriovorus str. Tiberius TaxID=1069642 RepID=K7YY84_BDEBC|nr:cyclic nucleotide-binding domain-containing protein [Bdellovibrio bacteriovorus]AFY02658.1 cyclic AMP receptor protein,catabolite gene activator [Bdellovibrio bacteriovorus str. Tiberius]